MMSFLLFAVSAVLLAGTAAHVTRWVPALPGSRFWTFLAAISIQLTLLHMGVSLFHQLTPTGFLTGQLLLSAGTFSFFTMLGRRLKWQPADVSPATWLRRLAAARSAGDPIACALLLSILLVLVFALTEQMLRPVTGFDERMYNCSRILYWHQHHHIWPWISQNEAQLDLPFGSEMFFSWPVLFTKIEWTARLIYWLGFPSLVTGVYLLARAIGSPIRVALIASLVVAATPTILTSAGINQKQDIWTAAFLVGVGYWTVQCLKTGGLIACLWSGVFLALATNVKVTNVAVTPVVAAAAMMAGSLRSLPKRWALQTVGGISGILLSGLAVTFAHNIHQYGNPISSPGSKSVIQPDFTAQQTYTHAVRIPAFLIELPEQPIEPFRAEFEAAGNRVIEKLGAGTPLRLENNPTWPGAFKFSAAPWAQRYSLGGTVWFFMLLVGAVVGIRELVTQRFRLSPMILILAMSGIQLASLAFMIRWMGGAPDRYWMAPYSLGIPASIALLSFLLRGKPLLLGAALLLVPLTVYPATHHLLEHLNIAVHRPPSTADSDEPFTEAITRIPPGSRIMLFGSRNIRDYPLFRPRDGYPNTVFPYGKSPHFDFARIASMIEDNHITHILFEDDHALSFHWDGGFLVEEVIEWLDRRPDLIGVPLATPNQRLFQRMEHPASSLHGFGGCSFPEGLDAVEGPYAATGPTCVRWGIGDKTKLQFTGRDEPLVLQIEAQSNGDPSQAVTVKLNGVVIGSHSFSPTREWETFEIPLTSQPGSNALTIKYASQISDRHLAVLYRTLRISNVPK